MATTLNNLTAAVVIADSDIFHIRKVDNVDYKILFSNMKSDAIASSNNQVLATSKAVKDLSDDLQANGIPDLITESLIQLQIANWTETTSPVQMTINDLAQGSDKWIAVGNYNSSPQRNMAVSYDNGKVWQYLDIGATNRVNDVESITTDGAGIWVAVCSNGTNRFLRSTDNGLNWTGIVATEANTWQGVDNDLNGNFVAISRDGTNRIARSTDSGANWSAIASPSQRTWENLSNDNGSTSVWVAVSDGIVDREFMRSTDSGANWSSITPVTNEFISYKGIDNDKNGIWCATGIENNDTFIVRSTDNGASWTSIKIDDDFNIALKAIVTDDLGHWVTCAVNSPPISSVQAFNSIDNGATWKKTGIPNNNGAADHILNSIEYGENIWIMGGKSTVGPDAEFIRSLSLGC